MKIDSHVLFSIALEQFVTFSSKITFSSQAFYEIQSEFGGAFELMLTFHKWIEIIPNDNSWLMIREPIKLKFH